MLYIKIDPSDTEIHWETHCNSSYNKINVSGAPQVLEKGPWGVNFVKFEGLLACYISKLIPMIGKLIATHLTIRLVCQGPPRPL